MELKLSKAERIILERLNSGTLRAKPPLGNTIYILWGIITTPILFVKFLSEIDIFLGNLRGDYFGIFDTLFMDLGFDVYDFLGIKVWPADDINVMYSGWDYYYLGFFIICSIVGIVFKSSIKHRGYSITNYLLNLYFVNILGIVHLLIRDPKIDSDFINELIPKAAKVKEAKRKADQAAKKAREEAKRQAAEAKKKLEEKKQKKILTLTNKFGKEELTKALKGKIWANMSFQLYKEAQELSTSGREFGKKFENVVNGEERHKYRFDPYENRQGKISYKFEVDTKAGVITGWKEL